MQEIQRLIGQGEAIQKQITEKQDRIQEIPKPITMKERKENAKVSLNKKWFMLKFITYGFSFGYFYYQLYIKRDSTENLMFLLEE